MKNNSIVPILKKDLYLIFTQSFFYITAIVFNLFCTCQFFFIQQFFVSGIGTTDLSRFFSAIPYILSVLIPSISLQNKYSFDETLPFSTMQKIASKFLALLIEFIVMLLPLIVFCASISVFGDIEVGQVICSFIGIIFYVCSTIAFCLFMSELIESRSAFFILTTLILFAINFIHLLPMFLPISGFLSRLIQAISFSWHFNSAGKGILNTQDLSFFFLVTVFFLLLLFYKIESKKGKLFFSKSLKTNSVLIILIFAFLSLNLYRYSAQLDFTKDKQFSPSSYTKNLVKEINEPLKISYYRSRELLHIYPQVRDVYDFLKIVENSNSKISVTLLDPLKSDNKKVLDRLQIQSQQIHVVKENKDEYTDVYSAIILEYLDRIEVIPFVLSNASLEYELDTRIEYLIRNTIRSVYLLCGNGRQLDTDYQYVYPWLMSQGMNCITSNFDNFTDTSIPLVLFGTSKLSVDDSSKIENFIARGGKALVMTSPFTTEIEGSWNISENKDDTFIPVIEKWGLQFERRITADISNVRASFYSANTNDSANQDNTRYEYVNNPFWISVLPQKSTPEGVTLFWASPIQVTNAQVATPLLYTTNLAWAVSASDNLETPFITNPFIMPKTAPTDQFTEKGQFTLGAHLNGKVEGYYSYGSYNANVILISDQYFANGLMVELSGGQTGDTRNFNYLTKCILDLYGKSELSDLQTKGYVNRTLYKITDMKVFEKAKTQTFCVNFIFIPLIYIFFMIFIFTLRRIKNDKDN